MCPVAMIEVELKTIPVPTVGIRCLGGSAYASDSTIR